MKFAAINGTSIHYKLENSGLEKPLIVFSNSLATDFASGKTVSMIYQLITVYCDTTSADMACPV